MTENKRFKQLTEEGFTHAFIDMENLDISYICDNSNDCKNIVDLLNGLNEEIYELTQEMGELGRIHAEEINKIEDEFDEEILKLEKENEQLKSENEYLKQRLDDVLQELYCKDRKLEELNVDIECCDKE